MKKTFGMYIFFVGLFVSVMWTILRKGSTLTLTHVDQINSAASSSGLQGVNGIFSQFLSNIHHPFSLLLLQTMIILITARLFGLLSQKVGLPSVIGEITAGIALGPSLLGYVSPSAFCFLFPESSLGNLKFLSQIGLVLFMFIIGMELDLSKLKNKKHHAVFISHFAIFLSFTIGIIMAYFIYFNFAPRNIPFLSFALFIGVSISITAFPVLARIISEKGLKKTALGTMALASAAIDDVTAWCLLACVIAVVKAGSVVSALFTIVLAMVFVVCMLYVVQPLMRRVFLTQLESEHPNQGIVAVSFFTMLVSAYIAEIIGIHALFGAFMAGVVMPHSVRFKTALTEKVEDVSLLMFLPIFFAYSGLRTQITLLNDIVLWKYAGLIIFGAVVGKFGGGFIASKLSGFNWHTALSMGALLNTRGLVELVVLNIGLDLGVLSPKLFAIMVIMALVTTFMTGPILHLIDLVFGKSQQKLEESF